jgi:hypothetical protein
MMSETRARASLLARWLGSLERNGFRGRRAPPSPATGDGVGAEVGGRAGVGALDGRPGAAPGLDGGLDGTNGGADGPDAVEGGVKGGADGKGAPGDCGRTEGGVGGELNSGSPVEGDGGVAVAVTDDRSIDSGLGRGAAGVSTASAALGEPRRKLNWREPLRPLLLCGEESQARCGADANGGDPSAPSRRGERDWSREPDPRPALRATNSRRRRRLAAGAAD